MYAGCIEEKALFLWSDKRHRDNKIIKSLKIIIFPISIVVYRKKFPILFATTQWKDTCINGAKESEFVLSKMLFWLPLYKYFDLV